MLEWTLLCYLTSSSNKPLSFTKPTQPPGVVLQSLFVVGTPDSLGHKSVVACIIGILYPVRETVCPCNDLHSNQRSYRQIMGYGMSIENFKVAWWWKGVMGQTDQLHDINWGALNHERRYKCTNWSREHAKMLCHHFYSHRLYMRTCRNKFQWWFLMVIPRDPLT